MTELKEISQLDGSKAAARTRLLKLAKQIGLVKTRSGSTENGGGTWFHPKLAIRFAQWLDVRFAIWCDDQIEQLLKGSHPVQDKKRVRHKAAVSYQICCQMLKARREADGKETASHHYSNEALMINEAVTGQRARLDRDSLSMAQLDLLAKAEMQDTLLIAMGATYDQRKAQLISLVNQHRQRLEMAA